MYIPSHYIFLFWEFSSWNVKKPKQYKNGKNALRLQAPVISTIYNVYILSISPPGYQRVTSQKKGILVDVTRDVGDTWPTKAKKKQKTNKQKQTNEITLSPP
jgi:hypothetical protein